MTESKKRALVVGGGIAGPVAAFWLAKGGWNVTMIDRAKTRNFYGQGIDITGPAAEVVRKMGLMDKIKARCTNEGGFAMCRDNGSIIAALGVSGTDSNRGTTLTQEIEIMRGDLADIFTTEIESMTNRVTVRYNCTILEIHQSPNDISALLSDSEKPETFDAIIGADGVRSATRDLSFPPSTKQTCLKPLNIYAAFFSAPAAPADTPYGRWQNAPGGRSIIIRPVTKERSSIYCNIAAHTPEIDAVLSSPRDEQKAAIKKVFADFPGLGERAIEQIDQSDNFYLDHLTQVKLPTFSEGRVALIGDAAYCPTPLTGKGTSLAITGAYIVAGELCESPDDVEGAFGRYWEKMREHAGDLQTIPLGGYAPYLLNPKSRVAIAVLRAVFKIIAVSRVWKLGDLTEPKYKFKVPEYCNNV